MTAAEIARLKKIAQAATPGEWTCHFEDLRGGRYYCVGRPMIFPRDQEYAENIDIHDRDNGEADGHHIATFAPPTVLSLLTALEQSQAALAEMQIERDGARLFEKSIRAHIAALEAENKALREGLKPFADHADYIDREFPDDSDDDMVIGGHVDEPITAGMCRRARALLQDKPDAEIGG